MFGRPLISIAPMVVAIFLLRMSQIHTFDISCGSSPDKQPSTPKCYIIMLLVIIIMEYCPSIQFNIPLSYN